MVNADILLIALPLLAYYVGRIICYFAREELEKTGKTVAKLVYLSPLLPAAVSLLFILGLGWPKVLISIGVTSLILLTSPKKLLGEYKSIIISAAMGLISGGLPNYFIILAVCFYFFAVSNSDFYSKDKLLWKKRVMEQVVFAASAMLAYLLPMPELSTAGAAAIVILLIRKI